MMQPARFWARSLVLLACLALFLPGRLMAADIVDLQATQKQLKELKSRMSKLEQRLNTARGEQGKLQAELARTERRISNLLGEIRDLERKITQSRQQLAELQSRELALSQELDQHKQQLAEQIRASYSIGENSSLRMLLALDSIEESERMLTYYNYFHQARTERINSYLVLLEDLKQTREARTQENTRLQTSREQLERRQQALSEARRSQQQTLAQLKKEIKTGESQLSRLNQDQKRLETLIKEVEQALADIPMPQSGQARDFREMRAKLSWPVRGKLLKQFSTRPDADGIKWNGIFIQSDRGTPVKAVHPGRVVFADWLRGFGLLVIVDHGKGYMSLYGSNQALYKQPGDWVQSGETLGSVGASGGQAESGLYFEIRHKGEPQNPLHWLAK